MNPDVQTPHETTYGLVPVFSRRTFPPAPFPRAYVHAVIDDLSDAVQAVHALRADGTDARDIHTMACWDVVEAVEYKWQQQSHLSRLFMRLHSFFDEGLGDVYLQEALRGHHLILVRLHSKERMEQVREMLARHGAHQMKYVDTWVVRVYLLLQGELWLRSPVNREEKDAYDVEEKSNRTGSDGLPARHACPLSFAHRTLLSNLPGTNLTCQSERSH